MRPRSKTLSIMGAGLTLAVTAWALDTNSSKFLDDAIRGNLAEVRMGELAQKRGAADEVREFGRTLVTDHNAGFQKSSSLAHKLGMLAPTEPSADAAKDYDSMSKLSGSEFDKEFTAHMIKDHEKDIAAYRDEAKDGSEPQVAAYAQQTLPTLQKHLETAQTIEKDLKGKGSRSK
jgi:putative membrane protein